MMLDSIHSDFFAIQKLVYEPQGWVCKNVQAELESQEYGACTFDMNNRYIMFRVGKITPTKVGQFVTLWKRIGKGPIMPYDVSDPFDLVVIAVRNKDKFGQFVFSKDILLAKGIISKDGRGGKRALRLYPAWDVADNPQAKRTQAWQLNYFFEIKPDSPVDNVMLDRLFV